jgi:hypothetical protein
VDEYAERRLKDLVELMLPALNERQQRIFLAAQARYLGRGGIAAVARVSGFSRDTINNGLSDIERPGSLFDADTKVRQEGGGRKKAEDRQPGLVQALNALVEPETRGDPMSPLRWICKSTRQLAQTLNDQGFKVSRQLISRMLNEMGFSLQANVKVSEGSSSEDRDEQFRYINAKVLEFQAKGQPVISVDAKKKELVGDFKNAGREYEPKGKPVEARVHDFPDKQLGKAVPYGVYDLTLNLGWVSVGTSHDTAQFAVESIRRWWNSTGKQLYPDAKELLITADSGGSNSVRNRHWKLELSKLAEEVGLCITVCHLPPGTSKWNKIEHRLFSFITINWRGRPLTSLEVIVQLIGSTTTSKGLRVQATLDRNNYAKGIKVNEADFEALVIDRHEFRGEWNYTFNHHRESA